MHLEREFKNWFTFILVYGFALAFSISTSLFNRKLSLSLFLKERFFIASFKIFFNYCEILFFIHMTVVTRNLMKTADFTLPRSVIKRQRSQIRSEYKWLSVTSDSTTSTSDYEWPRVTTSDYNWLRARLRVTAIDYKVTTSEYEWLWVTTVGYKPLKVATSDYEPRYKWLQVTTNDCKQLPVKLQMTTTEIGNNLRHKNVYCLLWLHNNERRKHVEKCSKNSYGSGENHWKILVMQKQLFADVIQSNYS